MDPSSRIVSYLTLLWELVNVSSAQHHILAHAIMLGDIELVQAVLELRRRPDAEAKTASQIHAPASVCYMFCPLFGSSSVSPLLLSLLGISNFSMLTQPSSSSVASVRSIFTSSLSNDAIVRLLLRSGFSPCLNSNGMPLFLEIIPFSRNISFALFSVFFAESRLRSQLARIEP